MSNSATKPRAASANRLPSRVRNGSVYEQLREELRSSVLQHGQPGDRVPSERKLAQQFGVSPITISRALQELQGEGAIERIVGKGTFICKVSPSGAQSNAGDSASNGAMLSLDGLQGGANPAVLSDLEAGAAQPYVWILASLGSERNTPNANELWSHRLTSHVERLVQKIGGCTIVTDQEMVAADEIAGCIEKMVAQGVNGIVFQTDVAHAASRLWAGQLLRIQAEHSARGLTVTQVSFGNNSQFPLDTVRFSGEQGAFAATSHLWSLGHREIAFLSPSPETPWIADRWHGFKRALEAATGQHPDVFDERIFRATAMNDNLHPWLEAAREAGDQLLKANRFTAVVAANDAMAKAFIELASEHNLRVPDDLSVIGFDDVHYSSTLNLTTLHPPIEAMADAAAALTLKRPLRSFEQGFVEVVLNPTLVVRSSVRPI